MEALFARSLDLTYVGQGPALNAHFKSNGAEIRVIAGAANGGAALAFFTAGLQPPMMKPSELLAGPAVSAEPIPVYTGPTRTGAALIAAVAADADRQTPQHRGKKSRIAAKKPDAAAGSNADAKDTGKDAKSRDGNKDGKSGKHANAKQDAAPKADEKPAAATDKQPAKPAKPKTTAKRSTKHKPAG